MAFDIIKRRQVRGDWSMGAPLLVYGADMESELNKLRIDVDGLNADFTAWFKDHSDDAGAKRLWDQWVQFRDQVYKIYKNWFSTTQFWFTADHSLLGRRRYYDQVRDHQEKAVEWRNLFEKRTGEKATAPILANKPKEDSGGGMWKWVALLAAGGAGALFLSKKLGS